MNIRKRDAETTGVKPPDKALNQPTRYGETKMTQKFRKSGTIITLAREVSQLISHIFSGIIVFSSFILL